MFVITIHSVWRPEVTSMNTARYTSTDHELSIFTKLSGFGKTRDLSEGLLHSKSRQEAPYQVDGS